jgi:arginyl-tRNA synthetase
VKERTPVKHSIAGLLELKQSQQGIFELKLPLKNVKDLKDSDNEWSRDIDSDLVTSVNCNSTEILFTLDKQKIITETFNNPTNVKIADDPKKFIVEFSSPNIAKPFHMGHLRSTIIGNFLSNLLSTTNNNVVKMNYLGDFGTQFGFLKVGIELENLSDEDIKKSPLECLFKAYVTANASQDTTVADRARKVFEVMENGDDEKVNKQWEQIKQYTMDELKGMYERLNVVFDVYEFESMYRRNESEKVIAQLRERNLLVKENDGKLVVNVGDRRVPIVKSDSTTLYLTRDIAAILERRKRYQMDKIYYVVDNGQNDHFAAIKSIVGDLGFDSNIVHHVKFGRIKGMSTRKGSVVFLKDILDEAKELMFKKQQESQSKLFVHFCGIKITLFPCSH